MQLERICTMRAAVAAADQPTADEKLSWQGLLANGNHCNMNIDRLTLNSHGV